ncbi:MAG TPA: OmpA family protein [Kofleriaceae bacterium]|nr:OmpA family protein [Kofleriaceae bacterium]
MPRLAHALPALSLLLVASTASAQAIDDFRPAIDSRGYLTLNGSQTLGHTEMSFGLGSLEWGRKLLSFDAGPSTYSVDNMVSATLVAALGLHVGPIPLEVGASLPFTIMSGSHGTDGLEGQGVGDLGLHLKARLARAGRLGFAGVASVYVPTSNSRDPFLGESSTTPQLMGVADATFGRLRVAVNAGVRLRQTTTMTMDMGSITTSTDLPVGVAAAYGIVPEKVELIGELFGAQPVGPGARTLEALGGVKVYLARNSYLSLGAGRGLLPGEVGNPDFRAMISIVFEPKPAQRMAYTVPDEVIAEAPPAPRQDDGTGDRDNDLIRDLDDRCPDDMEDYDGEEDEDGCPEPSRDRVAIGDSEITTLQPIEFEFDKDVLRDSAYPILDEIVKALISNPDMKLVEVQGHTDEQGNDAYNKSLSERRAATVMHYLLDHGIATNRLTSHGYGEEKPVDPHHTQEAYRINRRVAFVIMKR